MRVGTRLLWIAGVLSLWMSVNSAVAAERILLLSLESPSFVSFSGEAVIPLSEGARIRFRVGEADVDGNVPFRILPEDVTIGTLPVAPGVRGTYRLAEATSGTMRRGADGRFEIEFPATIEAVSFSPDGSERKLVYSLTFTTERAVATGDRLEKMADVTGRRLGAEDRKIELVAALTNRADAAPVPGAATFAVLTGTFDRAPGDR